MLWNGTEHQHLRSEWAEEEKQVPRRASSVEDQKECCHGNKGKGKCQEKGMVMGSYVGGDLKRLKLNASTGFVFGDVCESLLLPDSLIFRALACTSFSSQANHFQPCTTSVPRGIGLRVCLTLSLVSISEMASVGALCH